MNEKKLSKLMLNASKVLDYAKKRARIASASCNALKRALQKALWALTEDRY